MASVELHVVLGAKGDGFKRGRQDVVVSTHNMVPPSVALDEQELVKAKKKALARLRGPEKAVSKDESAEDEDKAESAGDEGKDATKKRMSFKKP